MTHVSRLRAGRGARFFRTPKASSPPARCAARRGGVRQGGRRPPMATARRDGRRRSTCRCAVPAMVEGRWEFPSGAVLTGMLVGMVMSPHEPWCVGAASAGRGRRAEYVLRTRSANMFNPAALALVGAYYARSGAGHSWWGAPPDMSLAVSIPRCWRPASSSHRVNKLPLVLAFLGVFYGCFTAAAFTSDPARVAKSSSRPTFRRHCSLRSSS